MIPNSHMLSIGIVGGGPGGLMVANLLKDKLGHLCRVSLFEASDRLGGKIVTHSFESAPALYEAGVAELYDYSMIGPDALRNLITVECGLAITPIDGEAVVLDGAFHNTLADLSQRYGKQTIQAIDAFRKKCMMLMSPFRYYEGAGKDDNAHPWATVTARDLLDKEVPDATAQRFLRVMSRSDIASELHLTNGLNALKNFLMDVDGYIGLYSINGGIERFIDQLATRNSATIEYGTRVNRIGRTAQGRYRLDLARGLARASRDVDLVLVCLPHNWLSTVTFEGAKLERAMADHLTYFDRPAHYLRIAALFKEPFWRDHVTGAWFMSEAFGGCCVYDEGARHDTAGHGVLNWLIAGSDVLAWGNLSDEELVNHAIATLPDSVRDIARAQLREVRVHRYLAAVNALPGGLPVRDPKRNHLPEPCDHPGLLLVGDYMFDSTLNGLLDSAEFATDLALSQVMRLRYQTGAAHRSAQVAGDAMVLPPPSAKIDRAYFENYRGCGPYAQAWRQFTDPDYLTECFREVFAARKGAKVLVAGSASGELVGALRAEGLDAQGIENNAAIHAKTPAELKPFNRFGSVLDLPFQDDAFDIVYETCLCHVTERRIGSALEELWRVCRGGLMVGSVTSDLTPAVLDRYDLLRGVQRLASWWEWSEDLLDAGFELAIQDTPLLDRLWEKMIAAGRNAGFRYNKPETLLYCFFRKVSEEAAVAAIRASGRQ